MNIFLAVNYKEYTILAPDRVLADEASPPPIAWMISETMSTVQKVIVSMQQRVELSYKNVQDHMFTYTTGSTDGYNDRPDYL